MKKNIHPDNFFIKVNCSCGNKMNILSTLNKHLLVDVCYKCHPFYTGQQKISHLKGRLERFKKRYSSMNNIFFNKNLK